MATNKITLTIHADEIDAKGIQNAVRRFVNANVEVPTEGTVEAKGVKLTVRPVTGKPVASKQDVRNWLATNGHPEVLGKRGRIAKTLLAEYADAHK